MSERAGNPAGSSAGSARSNSTASAKPAAPPAETESRGSRRSPAAPVVLRRPRAPRAPPSLTGPRCRARELHAGDVRRRGREQKPDRGEQHDQSTSPRPRSARRGPGVAVTSAAPRVPNTAIAAIPPPGRLAARAVASCAACAGVTPRLSRAIALKIWIHEPPSALDRRPNLDGIQASVSAIGEHEVARPRRRRSCGQRRRTRRCGRRCPRAPPKRALPQPVRDDRHVAGIFVGRREHRAADGRRILISGKATRSWRRRGRARVAQRRRASPSAARRRPAPRSLLAPRAMRGKVPLVMIRWNAAGSRPAAFLGQNEPVGVGPRQRLHQHTPGDAEQHGRGRDRRAPSSGRPRAQDQACALDQADGVADVVHRRRRSRSAPRRRRSRRGGLVAVGAGAGRRPRPDRTSAALATSVSASASEPPSARAVSYAAAACCASSSTTSTSRVVAGAAEGVGDVAQPSQAWLQSRRRGAGP